MKRVTAGFLWLVAVASVGNALAFFVGIPAVVAPLAAVIVSAFVVVDPMHWFWPAAQKRTTAARPSSSLQVSAKESLFGSPCGPGGSLAAGTRAGRIAARIRA